MRRDMTGGVFLNSHMFKHIAAIEANGTWEDAHTIHKTLRLTRGTSLVLWQYVYKCKVFNKADMYINDAEFYSNNFVKTDSESEPTCNPNEDRGFQECEKASDEEGLNQPSRRSQMVSFSQSVLPTRSITD